MSQRPVVREPKKIMVRSANWVGDAVMSIPALEALRKRQEWVRRYCSHAKEDPQCQFHLKKQMYTALRQLQRADRSDSPDDYCDRYPDDEREIAGAPP